MSSTLPAKPLLAGACLASDTKVGIKCAYQPSDCQQSIFGDSEIYVSPLWLEQNNPNWATRCGSQKGIRTIQGLGRCQSEAEDFLCTSDKSACTRSLSFERPVNDCNLLQDTFLGTKFDTPLFGRCSHSRNPARDFCAWGEADCEYADATVNSEFTFGVADPNIGRQRINCGCDDVHVGACVNEGDTAMESVWYCAVSEEVCGATEGEENFRYYPVLEFQAYTKTSCRLCDSTSVDIPPSPSLVEPNPTASPVVTPKTPIANPVVPSPTFGPVVPVATFSPPKVPTAKTSLSSRTNSNDTNNAGIVIGSVIGGLAGAVVMTLIILVSTKGRGSSGTSNIHFDVEGGETVTDAITTDDIEVEDLPPID